MEAEKLETFLDDIESYLNKHTPGEVKTTITGKSVLDVQMIQGLTTGRYKMTLIGMGLVFLSLLLIYRHPVKAFIPLLLIIMIVGWSGLVMYLFVMVYTHLTVTLW